MLLAGKLSLGIGVATIVAAIFPAGAAAQADAPPLAPAVATADTFGWKNSLVAGMNFSQSAFDNWAGGGTSSVAWAWSLLGTFHERRPAYEWRHRGQLEYGLVKQEKENLRKSVDLIELETLYTRKIDFFVNPYAGAGVKTQFTKGRDFGATPDTTADNDLVYPITSDFADPLYFSQSVGVGRYLVPEELNTRLGFSVREVLTDRFREFSRDEDEDAIESCTDNPACDDLKVETGLESITEYAKKLSANTSLASKLGFFFSFEQPDELDMSWRSDLSVKVVKVIAINFGLELLYDEDVLARLQTKQLLGVGLSYSLL
jgi:hypothetical protein